MVMELSLFKRAPGKKGEVKRIRREGDVPGVLYGLEGENQSIYVKGDELQAILRKMPKGLLSTTVFTLKSEGQVYKALVKGIQYHPVSYAVEHLDFLILRDGVLVDVQVPIELLGVAECPGVKLGGFLRQVVRWLKVRCLPQDIPSSFSLDVRDLQLSRSKALSDIEIPSVVRPLARKMDQVAVVVGKR